MEQQPLAIGIDFGGSSIKFGVVQGDQILFHSPSIATQDYDSPEPLMDSLAQFIKQMQAQFPEVKAVGMGMPGFVNFVEGSVFTLTNVAGWNNVQVRDMLLERVNLPVFVDNDANCMAYAEWKCGAGQGKQHLICLTLGTGVGSGIILNNQLYRGAKYGAGELGQTSIDFRGRLGHYGNRGALEDYIGNKEIAADARSLYSSHGYDKAIVDCSPTALENAARAGDPIAQEVWKDIARKLSSALVNCCYLLNPEAIVIGGGIAKAKDLLFEPLKVSMQQQLSGPFWDSLEILPAKFSNNAGIIGSANLALAMAHS